MNKFYEKYQDTIKKVTRRNYRKRAIWLNEWMGDKCCHYCGESENACLQFYPHDKKIRSLSNRKGLNEESRQEVVELIEQSTVVCANCFLKLDNDLIDIM